MTDEQDRNFQSLWRLYNAGELAEAAIRDYSTLRGSEISRRISREGSNSSLIQFLRFCSLLEAGVESRTLEVPASAADILRRVLELRPVRSLSSQFLMRLPPRLLKRLQGEGNTSSRRSYPEWYRKVLAFDLSFRDADVEEFFRIAGLFGELTNEREDFVEAMRDPDHVASAITTPASERSAEQNAVMGLETFLLLASDLERLIEESPTQTTRGKVIEIYAYILHRRGNELALLIDEVFKSMSEFSPDLALANIQERDALDRLLKRTGQHFFANEAVALESAIQEFLQEQAEAFGPSLRIPGGTRVKRPWLAPVRLRDVRLKEQNYSWLRRQLVRPRKEMSFNLVGAPGSGKTTLLHRLAVDISERYLRNRAATHIAILVPARKLPLGRNLFDAICEYTNLDHDALTYAFGVYNIVLLIDGLDELDELSRKQFVAAHFELRLAVRPFTTVVSTRPGDFDHGIKEFYPVILDGVPITEARDWAVSRDRIPSDLPRIMERISSETITALDLTLIAAVGDYKKLSSVRPGKVIAQFIDFMLDVSSHSSIFQQRRRESFYSVISRFSYDLLEMDVLALSELEALKKLAEIIEIGSSDLHAAEVLDALVSMRLFFRDSESYEFRCVHRSFIDHLAARHCLETYRSHAELAGFLLFKLREDRLDSLVRSIVSQWDYDEVAAFNKRLGKLKSVSSERRGKLLRMFTIDASEH